MSLTLDLDPEVENRVREYAAAEGVSVEELLVRALPPRVAHRDPRARVQALLAKWQAEDDTPVAAPVKGDDTLTPSEVLFHKWEREDDALNETERQAQAEQWEQFQQQINAERARAGMRSVF